MLAPTWIYTHIHTNADILAPTYISIIASKYEGHSIKGFKKKKNLH